MNDFLKHYNLKIQALAPIHIGSGAQIGKKEYIYLPKKNKVIIPDVEKIYTAFRRKYKEQSYVDYMMREKKLGLGEWLNENGYKEKDFQAWKRYELDAGDAFIDRAGSRTPKEIAAFMKDAYGKPYVPGSSLKGMLRTALLSYEITQNPGKYAESCENLRRNSAKEYDRKPTRDRFLKKDMQDFEVKAFHTLEREPDKIKKDNAVNCNLSGLIVSGSKPLDLECLTLSQKIDYRLDGGTNILPILRETIKPGTDIYFEVTIDEKQCPYSIETILTALDEFQKASYEYFYSRFKRGRNESGIVWLGGGCGFLSKTINYPAFGKQALKVTDDIDKITMSPKIYREHNHDKDLSDYKLAPHVCKCTQYHGELYDMGMGRIELLESQTAILKR